MKYLTIKKDKVIQALKTEPLTLQGFFFLNNGVSLENCQVCAVGAVLRHHISVNKLLKLQIHEASCLAESACKGQFAAEDADPETCIKDKNYLGALSVYFERLAEDADEVDTELREKLVNFVEKNFPASFRVKVEIESELG